MTNAEFTRQAIACCMLYATQRHLFEQIDPKLVENRHIRRGMIFAEALWTGIVFALIWWPE